MIKPHRSHPLWIAFLLHRVSGLALALFLPVHFHVLSLALSAPQQLDRFLVYADLLPVKIVEFVLVFLLAVHVFGGMRLMAVEWLPWTSRQKTLVAVSVALALFVATIFFLKAY